MDQLALDVVATRGADVESRHRVHAAVVDASGALDRPRRTIRPSSALAVVREAVSGHAAPRVGRLRQPRTGATTSSRSPARRTAASPSTSRSPSAMLDDIGMEEGDLACGPHDPLSPRGMKAAARIGRAARRACTTTARASTRRCSRARRRRVGRPYGYERREHPVQRYCLRGGRAWAGVPAGQHRPGGRRLRRRGVRAPARDHGARLVAARARVARSATRSRRASCTRCGRALSSSAAPIVSTRCSSRRPRAACIAKIGAEGVHSRRHPRAGDRHSRSRSTTARSARSSRPCSRVLQLFDVLPGDAAAAARGISRVVRFATRAARSSARFASPERTRSFATPAPSDGRRRPARPRAQLDDATRALGASRGGRRRGSDGARARRVAAPPIRAVWVEELVLQTYLFAGFPRALNAMREWRRVADVRAPAPTRRRRHARSTSGGRDGEQTCAAVYGDDVRQAARSTFATCIPRSTTG